MYIYLSLCKFTNKKDIENLDYNLKIHDNHRYIELVIGNKESHQNILFK